MSQDSCTVDTDCLSFERKLIVVFDICSSTKILEELKRTDNLECWRNFLIGLKDSIDHFGANATTLKALHGNASLWASEATGT
jgi:hypothetical protein